MLRHYVDRVADQLPGVRLMFMQSNGGLTEAMHFRGKDAILSGPAGGIVGMSRMSALAGFDKVIGFDMGGTSTDVSHFAGEYERVFHTVVAGVRLRAPMMDIHTVAAGGGSILHFDGSRYRVGPDSAGADPGPACYRGGGPLTVTDANVMLGRVQPAHFPHVFGPGGDEPLDEQTVRARFTALAAEIRETTGDDRSPEEVAAGFLQIAVANMANAVKRISVQKGHDVTEYALTTFGGAGGQHACAVADALGIRTVLVPPLAGVLSALGMGLADTTAMREQSVVVELDDEAMPRLRDVAAELEAAARTELLDEDVPTERIDVTVRAHLRYDGTDTSVPVALADPATMTAEFEAVHRRTYSFLMDRPLIVDAVAVEAVGATRRPDLSGLGRADSDATGSTRPSPDTVRMFVDGSWREAPLYRREHLAPRRLRGRPGHRRGGQLDHRRRGRLGGGDVGTGSSRAGPGARPRRRGGGHPRRSGHARDLQQPVHVDRRADGHDSRVHRAVREHQGASGLLVRAVRSGRKPDRERAAHPPSISARWARACRKWCAAGTGR